MPVLGYGQVSGIAPGLFQDAGDSIVAGIRRTGQEIRKNLQTVQTNKQLNAFGQEAATLDPAAPNFASSLMGLAGKYPLAASSEAGQTMVGLLSAANKNALGLEMDARNFNQQRALNLQNHHYRMNERQADIDARGPTLMNTGGGLYKYDQKTGAGEIVEGTEPLARPDPMPPRPIVIPGVGAFDAVTRQPIPGMQIPPKTGPSDQGITQAQSIELNLRKLDNEIDNLTTDLKSEPNPARKKWIEARLDDKRRERDAVEISTPQRPVIVPSMLGGINPVPIAVDPMNSGAPVPQVGGGQVLPPVGAIPEPKYRKGVKYRDAKGVERLFDGQGFVAPP